MSGQATILTKRFEPGTIGKVAAFLSVLRLISYSFSRSFTPLVSSAGIIVPKTIDSGLAAPLGEAAIINLLLMTLFALQHSVMARRQFKQWWTRLCRSQWNAASFCFRGLALILLSWQWWPIPAVVGDRRSADCDGGHGVSLVGWLIVLTQTFLIHHFELFGLHQVVNNLAGRDASAAFQDRCVYIVRATSDLSRFNHCVLGHAHDDRRTSAVRDCNHCLYFYRHFSGGARPDRNLR